MNWDELLLTIQLELETNDILYEVTKIYNEYRDDNKCIECGEWANVTHYGNKYCVSCYEEMQFQE